MENMEHSKQPILPRTTKVSVTSPMPNGFTSDYSNSNKMDMDDTRNGETSAIINKKEEEVKFSFFTVSREKKFLLLCMGFVNFCAMACYSLLAPFFPKEAEYKGASQTVIGMIFGIYELIVFITAPIYGNFITRLGAKFTFLSGIMVCGSCTVLFGVLDKSPPGNLFTVMCFLTRSVEALGTSAFVTASFTIASHSFPNNIATVIASLETCTGVGLMVGPTIGSALYEIGGYGLPFFVMGGVLIFCGFICWIAMPKIDDSRKAFSGSVLSLLRSPLCLVTDVSVVSSAILLGFLEPTLANHLYKLNLSQIAIGVMFLIQPGAYAIMSPFVGCLGDSKRIHKGMVAVGNFVAAFSFLMVGPSPLLPFYPFEIWSIVLCLLVMGTSASFILIPSFQVLFDGAGQLGMEANFDTFGMVSGMFLSCFSLGAFLGPTVGGALVDQFGFSLSSTMCAGLSSVAGLLMVAYCVIAKYTKCLLPRKSGYDPLPGCNDISETSLTIKTYNKFEDEISLEDVGGGEHQN